MSHFLKVCWMLLFSLVVYLVCWHNWITKTVCKVRMFYKKGNSIKSQNLLFDICNTDRGGGEWWWWRSQISDNYITLVQIVDFYIKYLDLKLPAKEGFHWLPTIANIVASASEPPVGSIYSNVPSSIPELTLETLTYSSWACAIGKMGWSAWFYMYKKNMHDYFQEAF